MKEKVLSYIKLVLFLGMLVGTYFVTEKFIDYILTVDVEILKRTVNMILIVLTTGIYFKKPTPSQKKNVQNKH